MSDTLLLAVAGGESSDAAALREHAAENRDAAVTSGIVRVQSATDCDGDVVAEGNVSAESSEKMISPAVADPPDVKPSPPGAAGNTVNENRLKPCRQRLFGLQGDLKSETQNGNPSSQSFFTVILIQPYLPANHRGDAHESSRDHDQRS
jgi:hypothetical protein